MTLYERVFKTGLRKHLGQKGPSVFLNRSRRKRPSVFLNRSQRLVAADGEYSDKDKETKHFGLIWVRICPGWPGGWPAEAAGKAGCFFKPARFLTFWLQKNDDRIIN